LYGIEKMMANLAGSALVPMLYATIPAVPVAVSLDFKVYYVSMLIELINRNRNVKTYETFWNCITSLVSFLITETGGILFHPHWRK